MSTQGPVLGLEHSFHYRKGTLSTVGLFPLREVLFPLSLGARGRRAKGGAQSVGLAGEQSVRAARDHSSCCKHPSQVVHIFHTLQHHLRSGAHPARGRETKTAKRARCGRQEAKR